MARYKAPGPHSDRKLASIGSTVFSAIFPAGFLRGVEPLIPPHTAVQRLRDPELEASPKSVTPVLKTVTLEDYLKSLTDAQSDELRRQLELLVSLLEAERKKVGEDSTRRETIEHLFEAYSWMLAFFTP